MIGDSPAGRLVITWQPHRRQGAGALTDLVATFADTGAERISVIRACRSCGSDRHGQPRVIAPIEAGPLFISVSHSGGRTVTAVTDAGPVGVDVEEVQLGLDPDALTTWVRKESLVKATGHGLSLDPELIDIGPPGRPASVVTWPAADPLPAEAWIVDLESPPGFVAAVTVLADTRPRLITAWGAPAA